MKIDKSKKTWLISIEGSDGAGKETQTKLLTNHLSKDGYTVATVSFPQYNKTFGGSLLYEVIKSERSKGYNFSKVDPKFASLLYAMDRKESSLYLHTLMADNDIVILDRYVESNLLHQGGKYANDDEKVEFAEWLFHLEYEELKLPKPSDIVYLSLPWEFSQRRAQERAKKSHDTLDAVESDTKYVKDGMLSGIFYAKYYGWKIIDCAPNQIEMSQESVHKKIYTSLGFLCSV